MTTERMKLFGDEREALNETVMKYAGLSMKRFYNLDMHTYEAGAMDAKTKELMGLVASVVLRCDDCITYHLVRCREEGVTFDELLEAFNVALVVGGSITIPHLRRAMATLEDLDREEADDA